jgi:hypothetical protein
MKPGRNPNMLQQTLVTYKFSKPNHSAGLLEVGHGSQGSENSGPREECQGRAKKIK